MTMQTASRKDIQQFHQWLKRQPWSTTHFLYQTYIRDDEREQKLKDLFTKFAALTPEQRFPKQPSSPSGGTTPTPPIAPTTPIKQ